MADNVASCKKSKETLKKLKLRILLYKFGSRHQKSPKIVKKTITHLRFPQFFFIGMVYFGWYQVNPYVQAVQNMCSSKGKSEITKNR